MNFEKFTQKSLEAVQGAYNIAKEYGNPEVKEIHINYALLNDKEGLIPRVLTYMDKNPDMLKGDVLKVIERLPKQSGAEVYADSSYRELFQKAEDFKKKMGDDYLSVEHIYLALLNMKGTDSSSVFNKNKIDADGFLNALKKIRGNQHVTTDNPEGTYDALKKYG